MPPPRLGSPDHVLDPPDRRDEEDAILAKLRNGERVAHFESTRLTRDGRTIDVSLSLSPLHDATGKITGISKIARDITPRKLADKGASGERGTSTPSLDGREARALGLGPGDRPDEHSGPGVAPGRGRLVDRHGSGVPGHRPPGRRRSSPILAATVRRSGDGVRRGVPGRLADRRGAVAWGQGGCDSRRVRPGRPDGRRLHRHHGEKTRRGPDPATEREPRAEGPRTHR